MIIASAVKFELNLVLKLSVLCVHKAPVERVYFTGEHTSEYYNGYVHGGYLAGIHIYAYSRA